MQFLVYGLSQGPQPDAEPTPEFMAEMGRFIQEAAAAGVLVTTGSAQPQGKRLQLSNGKFSVTDGPLIEVKELTGGFAVIDVPSLEDAIEWCKRFRLIVGEGISEIVQIMGPHDFGG